MLTLKRKGSFLLTHSDRDEVVFSRHNLSGPALMGSLPAVTWNVLAEEPSFLFQKTMP